MKGSARYDVQSGNCPVMQFYGTEKKTGTSKNKNKSVAIAKKTDRSGYRPMTYNGTI